MRDMPAPPDKADHPGHYRASPPARLVGPRLQAGAVALSDEMCKIGRPDRGARIRSFLSVRGQSGIV
jgi:hypothetical protein